MKTASEILADEAISRQHRNVEGRKWEELVRRCRYGRGHAALSAQIVIGVGMILAFTSVFSIGDYRGAFLVAAVFGFVCMPLHIFYLRRKERALVAVIEQQAPELFRRLKAEQIV